jgi:two-component system catabolic regulation response regulator CreB
MQRARKEDVMKPRIVVVEDEPAISESIQYALETDGFEAVCLSTGGELLARVGHELIDLVVLDIGLPDMSGFEVCKAVRAHSTTPILFLTARSEEIDRVVGLEIGADDYMVKPFSPRELTARIKAILRRTRGAHGRNEEATAEGFQINDSKRQILYFGSGLELSNYEYRILATLIRRPGHVYSRDQLMDLVWEEPMVSMDRTVDVHIKNIRAKLRQVRDDIDPIVTHRGTGYALREGL